MSTVHELLSRALSNDSNLASNIEDAKLLLIDASRLGMVELVSYILEREDVDVDTLKVSLSGSTDAHTTAVLLNNYLSLLLEEERLGDIDEMSPFLLSVRDYLSSDSDSDNEEGEEETNDEKSEPN